MKSLKEVSTHQAAQVPPHPLPLAHFSTCGIKAYLEERSFRWNDYNVKPGPLLCILHMPATHLCHRSVGAEKKRYVECEPGFENTPDISGRVDIALEKGERERVRVKREITLKKTRCRNERE